MELKEFVSQTLIEITEGIKDAQSKCMELGGQVNPKIEGNINIDKSKLYYEGEDYYKPIYEVNFKVGLVESTSKGSKVGIGVFLPKLSLGTEKERGNESQSITSIEFSVPILFPSDH